jgi:hypothetical protein
VLHHPSLIPTEIQGLSIFYLKADGDPGRLKLSRISPQYEFFEVYFNKNHESLSNISTFIEDWIEISRNLIIYPYIKTPSK